MIDDAIDRLRLARSDGVGPIAYRRLLNRHGSPAAALAALPGLARAGGRATLRIPSVDAVRREIDGIAALGGRMLFLDRPGYPDLLARLDDAPAALAVYGDPDLLDTRAVAIVGSRNASTNGRRLAETLAAELAEAGITIVSGLARGVDAAAHTGALSAGHTIACIAGGFDRPYPPENEALQAQIAATGAVLAEAPLGTAPQSRHFPRRNRIIAGLSLGVVVIEAAERSGSLITARQAADNNREVFAVPGSPLDPRNRGSNNLLREGAHLAENAADVLLHLHGAIARSPAPMGLAETVLPLEPPDDLSDADLLRARSEITALLGPAPTPVDHLIRRCQFSAAVVMGVLLELEIAGRLESLPGNQVALLGD